MHNEKLFDKIRESVGDDTSELSDWDADEVWTDVNSRQSKSKRRWLWVRYAAAASVVLTSILVGFDVKPPAEKQMSFVQHVPHVEPDGADKSDSQSKQKPVIKKPVDPAITRKRQLVAVVTDPAAEPQSVASPDWQAPHFTSIDSNRIVHIEDIRPLADSSAAVVKPTAVILEKVLVADIDLPENITSRGEQLTSLQVMFITAKKEREARKLRVKYQNAKVPGLWSFVHHSLSESP